MPFHAAVLMALPLVGCHRAAPWPARIVLVEGRAIAGWCCLACGMSVSSLAQVTWETAHEGIVRLCPALVYSSHVAVDEACGALCDLCAVSGQHRSRRVAVVRCPARARARCVLCAWRAAVDLRFVTVLVCTIAMRVDEVERILIVNHRHISSSVVVLFLLL